MQPSHTHSGKVPSSSGADKLADQTENKQKFCWELENLWLNDKLYQATVKLFEDGEFPELINCYPENMIAVLLSRTNCSQEDTIYNISRHNNFYNYFKGYPQGNYLKQVS